MAYTSKQQYSEVVDAQDSSYVPDKSFIQAWEKYLADEDLEEEFEAFSEARSRFLGLISGSLGAEWMRQQAHWYLWAAEQEDELSLNSPPQSPSLSHSEEVMYPPVPMYGDVEEDNSMPDEALEYVEESSEEDVRDAAPASDDRDAWTQEDWDALYASQGPSYLEEVEQEEAAEPSEYEDPTVLEEDDWAAFQSWKVPPVEAREQYAGPAMAEGDFLQNSSDPADRPPHVWTEGPSWEQAFGRTPGVAPPSNFIAGQERAWAERPGVPMDTTAGRARMRVSFTSAPPGEQLVCYLCHTAEHAGSLCHLEGTIRARPSKSQAAQLRASRLRGRNSRNGGNVTDSPSPQSKDEENEKLHKLREYARDFRRQHTTDAEQFDWDSDDGDYGLAIGRLVVT
jgi:hypothetical protein